MKNALWTTVALFMFSTMAFADDTSSGCGLGWAVTKKQSLVSSSVRATTNYILPSSLSMTSGTAGCARHSIVKNDEAAVNFAVHNSDQLLQQMAEGRGEYLQAFAATLGCPAADREAFGAFTQKHFRSISSQSATGNGVDLYRAVRTQVMADPALARSCVPTA